MIRAPLLGALVLAALIPGAAAQAPPPLPVLRPAVPGLEALPNGAWRIPFRPGSEEVAPEARAGLTALARHLSALPAGRVTVEAQVTGFADDDSAARRLALGRARAVRGVLVTAGLPETRVDVRALGRTPEGLDAADILPPGVAHRTTTR